MAFEIVKFKNYYNMWNMNVKLKEQNMKLLTENDHLKKQVEELKSEIVVQKFMSGEK